MRRVEHTCCNLEVVALTASKGVWSGSCESIVYRVPSKWQQRKEKMNVDYVQY